MSESEIGYVNRNTTGRRGYQFDEAGALGCWLWLYEDDVLVRATLMTGPENAADAPPWAAPHSAAISRAIDAGGAWLDGEALS